MSNPLTNGRIHFDNAPRVRHEPKARPTQRTAAQPQH